MNVVDGTTFMGQCFYRGNAGKMEKETETTKNLPGHTDGPR